MLPRCADPLSEGFGLLAKAPSGKRDFQAMQVAFNRWEEQSGLDLASISGRSPVEKLQGTSGINRGNKAQAAPLLS